MKNTLKYSIPIVAALAAALLVLAPFGAAGDMSKTGKKLANAPDSAWIKVSGKVKSVSPDTFILDYGRGTIPVEMDDGDRDADAYKLLPGDKVTVQGRIDDDAWQRATIEAATVYVEKLNTYFYASDADEEAGLIEISIPVPDSESMIQGTVGNVSEDEFMVIAGNTALRVETEKMSSNPLDDEGYMKIKPGDKVFVAGELKKDFFEQSELVANTIVKIEG